MRIEKPEENKEKVEEKSVSTSIEQEVIDQYYDYVEYGGLDPVTAVYKTAKEDFPFLDVVKVETILRKYGVDLYESVEEKEDKKDDKAEEEEEKDSDEKDEKDEKDDKEDDEGEKEEKSCDSKKKESTVIEVEEDIRLPSTDIMLEKGDRIEVLRESHLDSLLIPFVRNIESAFIENGKEYVKEELYSFFKKVTGEVEGAEMFRMFIALSKFISNY